MDKIKKRKLELTKDEYDVTQHKNTEIPFSGKYNDFKESGIYKCTVCGAPLFTSENKYSSGSGWPSFDRPIKNKSVNEQVDNSIGMKRTEVVCKTCGSHLGHVFDDGPQDSTGKRYCINSISLKFKKNEN